MKLLSETVVEIDYFEMLEGVNRYLSSKLGADVDVAWIVSCQDIAPGNIPYQGSYRVKIKGKEPASS